MAPTLNSNDLIRMRPLRRLELSYGLILRPDLMATHWRHIFGGLQVLLDDALFDSHQPVQRTGVNIPIVAGNGRHALRGKPLAEVRPAAATDIIN